MFDFLEPIIIQPFVNALLFIYSLAINNFGLAIIAFTLLVRLITHPFTVQQIRSSQKMQEMQQSKKWKDMQKKYKDNREKLSQEQMKLYQEYGVNPLGACLPTLLQFPIIIGLYQAIIRALATTPLQLVQFSSLIYPFFPQASQLIPLNSQFLWIADLSQPERLNISFLPIGIPVLAILVVITSYLQSKLMTPMSAPGEQGAMMNQMMSLYMPLLFGYFAYSFSAGLALYFLTTNVFTIAQYSALGRVEWRKLIPSIPSRS